MEEKQKFLALMTVTGVQVAFFIGLIVIQCILVFGK
jgi:hypothetical protein